MNQDAHWLDCLPADAPERQLLLAAEADRPSPKTVDRGWQALAVSLGIASATAVATSTATATVAASASMAAGPVGKSAVGLAFVGKTVAIGFAIGMGVLGTSLAVVQAHHGQSARAVSTLVAVRPQAPRSRPLPAVVESVAAQPGDMAVPAVPAAAREPVLARRVLPLQVSPRSAPRPSPEPKVGTRESQEESLAAQAQELAGLKRLLDSGGQREVATRLRAIVERHRIAALAEDRDALYIEALAKAHRQADAREAASQFFSRYPHSPHRDKVRTLTEHE